MGSVDRQDLHVLIIGAGITGASIAQGLKQVLEKPSTFLKRPRSLRANRYPRPAYDSPSSMQNWQEALVAPAIGLYHYIGRSRF